MAPQEKWTQVDSNKTHMQLQQDDAANRSLKIRAHHQSANHTLRSNRAAHRTKVVGSHGTDRMHCPRRAKLFTVDEMEAVYPVFRQCHLTVYAYRFMEAIHRSFDSLCLTNDTTVASVIILPLYAAQECNWPVYQRGVCTHRAIQYRAGRQCRAELVTAANVMSQLLSKLVVIVDMLP